MKRILLVAATTGYQIRSFAEAAHRLGIEVALATDRCHVLEDPWRDRAVPIRFNDPASVQAIIAAGPFDGILAVGDRPAYFAALAAVALGVPFHSPASVDAARNKFHTKQRFAEAGLPVPRFSRMSTADDPAQHSRLATYPCVLKPLGLSASRGVIRVNNAAEFTTAFCRIKALLARPEIRLSGEDQDQYIQVESFLAGREYALEGLVTAGRLQTLAVFEKPDPLDGPFFEESIYLTPPRQPLSRLVPAAEQAVRALGLTHGPVHAEMRDDGEQTWVLEVAPRPIGGLCAKALRYDGAVPLEEILLRHAAGEDVTHFIRERIASGVMMIPIPASGVFESAEGVDNATAVGGVEEIAITAKAGQTLEKLPEGSSYLGFIFARGSTSEQVDRSLRQAHSKLRFRIAAKLPVI